MDPASDCAGDHAIGVQEARTPRGQFQSAYSRIFASGPRVLYERGLSKCAGQYCLGMPLFMSNMLTPADYWLKPLWAPTILRSWYYMPQARVPPKLTLICPEIPYNNGGHRLAKSCMRMFEHNSNGSSLMPMPPSLKVMDACSGLVVLSLAPNTSYTSLSLSRSINLPRHVLSHMFKDYVLVPSSMLGCVTGSFVDVTHGTVLP